AKNFQWGLRKSTLNHLMCMSYTDVAQVANAARNYEILQERDDDDTERPDKRQKSGDRHQPTSQQSSHRDHGHNNDRHGSERQSGGDNHRRIPVMGVTRETGVSSPTDLPFLVLSNPGVPLRATPIQFTLLVDADTHESVVELLDDKKPGASGRVFAITEGHAANTSGRRVVIGISRPLNRVVTGTTIIITTVMDQTGEVVVTTIAATTTTLATTTGVTREIGVSSPTDLPILVLSSPGVPLRATPTRSALRVDADTQEIVVELLADKKPGASGRVFAITEDHATKTSGTIIGTLFIYGHAMFVLFDTGATHSVISSVFASCVTTTPTLLDHVFRDGFGKKRE
nr:hypothetical protein [Tanacetum cinerariifolium]